MKTKKKSRLLILLLAGCMLTACSGTTGGEDNLILVEKETEPLTYEMASVSYADVIKTGKAKCTYQQVNDESLSFHVSGKKVEKVYVKEGDNVEKGQLLAELDVGDSKEVIRDLEYNIAKNELSLEYIDINENQEISAVWLRFLYQTGQSQQDKEATEESVKGIQQRYRYAREDCQDALDLDQTQLDSLKKDLKESYLYAGMSGMVSDVKDNLEGSTTVMDEEVIKIIDSTECLFAVEDVSLAEYFTADKEVELNLVYGSGAGTHKLLPYDMENWGDVLLFTMTGDTENVTIEVGTSGNIKYDIDSRENVLSIPLKAVHQADGKSFVYVLGDNQMREVKWIETGLFGDNYVEILSGLTEGEKVIVK